MGFMTPYASSEYREDFAETIACFITYTQEDWDFYLDLASRGWETDAAEDATDAVYYSFYYYPKNDTEQDKVPIYLGQEKNIAHVTEDGVDRTYWKNERDDNHNRIIVYAVEDNDGIEGDKAILEKVQIARQWFRDAWGVDLDSLRKEVQDRQKAYNMEELRKWVYDIQ